MLTAITQQTSGLSSPTAYVPVLLTLLVINALVLWRRYRSRRELLARIEELEALSQAGGAMLMAQLDFAALCDLIVAEANKVIDTQTFQLGFFSGDLYQIQSWMINGEVQEPRSFDLSENSGLVGWVRDNQKPLLIDDFLVQQDLPARPRYISDSPPRSAIFIPLMAQERVIGLLAAQSQHVRRFDQRHVRQLTILANQAAAAISNSSLFDEERRRSAQIALIGTITHQVNELEDLEEIFERVVELTKETFEFYQVNIFVRHPIDNFLLLRASSERRLLDHRIVFNFGEGVVGHAVSLQKTIIANDAQSDGRFKAAVGIPSADDSWLAVRSVMVSPLIVNKEVWGVLEVLSDKVDIFHDQEQEVLETLAAGIAIAIQKAQQLNNQRVQSWITTARLQVAEAISRSIDLEDVLENVMNLLPILLGVAEAGVLVWDENQQAYRGGYVVGVDDATADRFNKLILSQGDWGALDAVDIGQQPFVTESRPPWLQKGETPEPILLVPLLFDGRSLAILYLDDETILAEYTATEAELDPLVSQTFQERRHELLHDIANQLTQAIERTQLRRAQQEEAWVNTALLQVADAVNSLIELPEILDTIVTFVPMLVGVESCVVLFWDEKENLFHPGPSFGVSEMGIGILDTAELSRDELRNLSTLQAVPYDPHRIKLDHYRIQSPDWLQKVLGTNEACAIPLWAQGRFVGAMLAGLSGDDNRLSSRRLSILFGIAQQAATAVVNNQLYAEAAERDRLQRELDVARQIQSSLIPDGQPRIPHTRVASYWEAARQVSGDFYDFIQLPDGRWAIVIADVADKGVPAALFMAVSRTILRAVANSRSDPAAILGRTNDLILSDSDSDLFVTIFLAIWDPATQQFDYSCGGHNPPLLFHAGGGETLLQTKGVALGVIENVNYESGRVQLLPDDVVLLYTDGITEAINEDYDEFGMDRLRLAVNGGRKGDATEIVQQITSAVRDHAGSMDQFDDITMVVLKYCPN